MNKRLKTLAWLCPLLLICPGLAATSSAQEAGDLPSAEEVLSAYVKATGGVEKYKNLKNMSATGKISIPQAGIKGSLEMLQVAPNKVQVKTDLGGLGTIRQGSNGETAWELSVITGPRILKGEEAKQLMQEANLKKTYEPQSYYKEMKCVGTEDVDGEACYKLELTKPNGVVQTDYYSIESKLQVKSMNEVVTNMGEMKIAVKLGDYRETDGIKMPFKMEQSLPNGMSQIVQMDDIRINVEVPEGSFDLPQEIKEQIDQNE